jgi:hypothetical protein
MLNGSGLIHGIIEGLFVKRPMDETGALQQKYTFSKYRNLTYNCVGGGGGSRSLPAVKAYGPSDQAASAHHSRLFAVKLFYLDQQCST